MNIDSHGVHADGLKNRDGIPLGKWQEGCIEWFRDLGFLGKPGIEPKATRDVAAFAKKSP